MDSTTEIIESDTDTICYSDSDDEPYFYEDSGSDSNELDEHHVVRTANLSKKVNCNVQ